PARIGTGTYGSAQASGYAAGTWIAAAASNPSSTSCSSGRITLSSTTVGHIRRQPRVAASSVSASTATGRKTASTRSWSAYDGGAANQSAIAAMSAATATGATPTRTQCRSVDPDAPRARSRARKYTSPVGVPSFAT